MKKIKKTILLSVIAVCSTTFLTACGNRATTPVAQQQARRSSQQKSVQLGLYVGDIAQSENVLSMPVVVNNAGTDSTVISSQNFTLIIDGHKFKAFQVPDEPSDFHQDLGTTQSWQNVISFYIGTKLSNSMLKKAQLTYQADNGSTVKAQFLSSSNAQSKLQNVTYSGYTSVPDYYAKSKQYIDNAKETVKTGGSANSLKDGLGDAKYDRFRMWGVASSKFSDLIIIKAINNTNTDLLLPLKDFELQDKDKNDIQVHPTYRSYNVLIPHGKAVNVVIPMEASLKHSETPYKFLFRATSSSSYQSSADTFHPAEFVFNDAKDYSSALATTPEQYPKDSIKWSQIKLTKDTLKAKVTLYDYYFINSDASKYRLVGLNNDGTVGDSEKPDSVSPTKITGSGGEITFKFDDLTVLKSYKKIVLRYNDQTIFKIK